MKTKYSDDSNSLADGIITETDRVKRWRMIHDLLRVQNKKARKEQKTHAKAMADVRKNKLYNKRKARRGQLRFGVSIPQMTYDAIVETDILVFGKSDIRNPEKENFHTPDATNSIVKDLAKAFPEYKAS